MDAAEEDRCSSPNCRVFCLHFQPGCAAFPLHTAYHEGFLRCLQALEFT